MGRNGAAQATGGPASGIASGPASVSPASVSPASVSITTGPASRGAASELGTRASPASGAPYSDGAQPRKASETITSGERQWRASMAPSLRGALARDH